MIRPLSEIEYPPKIKYGMTQEDLTEAMKRIGNDPDGEDQDTH